jgi:hypothetical protein
MKRRTFYHLSLLLPYIALAFSLAFAFLTNALDNFFSSLSSLEIFAGVLAFFGFSGIIWGPLYTWMVIVAWVWGRKRKFEEVRLLYLLSPVLLACSMGIPVLILEPLDAGKFLLEGILRINNLGFAVPVFVRYMSEETPLIFGVMWLFMAVLCLVIGYAFVGIVLWIEKILSKRGLLKDETNS